MFPSHRHVWVFIQDPTPARVCAVCGINQDPWLGQQCTCGHRRVSHDDWDVGDHAADCLMCNCLRYT